MGDNEVEHNEAVHQSDEALHFIHCEGLLKKIVPAMPETSKSSTTATPALPEEPNLDTDSRSSDTSRSSTPTKPDHINQEILITDEVKSQETTRNSASGALSKSPTQSTVSIWDRARMGKLDAAKQHRITRMMAAYLVKDMRPFSTVQSENFRKMISTIDERVVIPNSATFSQRIIPSWYNMEAARLLEEMGKTRHVSLTSDCWTSRTTIPYMTVTAHFIDDQFDLKSKVLQTKVLDDRHTGENISVALNTVLQSWKIEDKVQVITTDNASNMGKGVRISDIELQVGCLAHTLDLAAKKAVEVAKPITKKMKPVIAFLHRSHVGAKVLKEKQEALDVPVHKLIMDVETRWNSTYLMCERFFEQRVAIHATFMDRRLEANKAVYRNFTDAELLKVEEFLDIMKPFYHVTLAVCSEKNPTASLILPLVDKLLKICESGEDQTAFSGQLKKAINDNLSKRYQEKEVRDLLQKCAALDPRMKKRGVIDEATWEAIESEIVELLEAEEIARTAQAEVFVKKEEIESESTPSPAKRSKTLMETLLNEDDEEVTVTDAYRRSAQEMARDEIKSYRSLPKPQDPLSFYQMNRFRLPHMCQLAAKYLCVQATSVASERVFSTSGDILSAERSCIDADALDAMIFLKKNASTLDFLV